MAEPERSRAARRAAEAALVRVVHHYGETPAFVVLGGLVPELLCAGSGFQHAGTTDVDVQVDLEIAAGAVNAARLEAALRNAEFEPDGQRAWRWIADVDGPQLVVKFELLADLDDHPAGPLRFDGAPSLGAANLRGTGFAAKDIIVRPMRARVADQWLDVEVNVAGLAGFLCAKAAAAAGRHKPKDLYDIAFVLLHNDEGGPMGAARAVNERFGNGELGTLRSAFDELEANFADTDAQGPTAYADQIGLDHPGTHPAQAAADALVAVRMFLDHLEG